MEFDLELFESGSGSFDAFEGNHADKPTIAINNDVCMQEDKTTTGNDTSLVERMQEDKKNVLGEAFAEAVGGDMNTWLESTSDYQSFVDLTANLTEEMKDESKEDEDIDAEALINNVEDFLKTYEASGGNGKGEAILPTTDADHLVDGSLEFPLANSTFTEEDTKVAEALLDSLLQGNDVDIDTSFLNSDDIEVVDETKKEAPAVVKQETVENQILGDSGFLDLSNVSQIVTEDGRNIIIMVAAAPASPAVTDTTNVSSDLPAVLDDSSFMNAASPAMSEALSEASTSKAVVKGRPTVKRSLVSKTRKAPYSIKDKKERKKLQNVEAARRYRDKKKAEQNDVESEEATLAERNKTLKSEVSELESEIRTMRKLMVELGILKQ